MSSVNYNNGRKYEFTEKTRKIGGYILHQIRALKDFYNVRAGDLGGWIEKEENLSHEGKCWVSGNATVCGEAQIYGNAYVYGNAKVSGNATVCGNAKVYDNAKIYLNGMACGEAQIYGNAYVYGSAKVYDNAEIYGDSLIYGDITIHGNPHIGKDAVISSRDDFIVFSNLGSRYDTTTFYKTETGCSVCCGCFNGTIDEFEAAVEKTHGNNKYGREYKSIINTARIHFYSKFRG